MCTHDETEQVIYSPSNPKPLRPIVDGRFLTVEIDDEQIINIYTPVDREVTGSITEFKDRN
jgi:hypothetical protein